MTYRIIWLVLLVFTNTTIAKTSIPPNIQLATIYQSHTDAKDYWVSEKLDGVRGYWDGKRMYTKHGNPIRLPLFFTEAWPATPLEGELWISRGSFESISSLVRRKYVDESEWQPVKFMLFDLPTHLGTFTERLASLKKLVLESNNAHLKVIEQFKVANNELLHQRLQQVVEQGGEGLMLHKANAKYHQGRTRNIVKLKPAYDDEAQVIAHIEGKGKYKNKLGALKVKTNDGIIFKIGTGFSDKERQNPPPIGSIITFKYSGKTHKGVPRFASFLRIRYLTKS